MPKAKSEGQNSADSITTTSAELITDIDDAIGVLFDIVVTLGEVRECLVAIRKASHRGGYRAAVQFSS